MFCKGLPPMNKSHYHLNKCSYKDTWQINYITPPLREEAGTYHDEFNTLKSHAPLITWPIAITRQLEGIISWPSPSSSPTFCFSVLKFSNNMHLDLFFNRDAFKRTILHLKLIFLNELWMGLFCGVKISMVFITSCFQNIQFIFCLFLNICKIIFQEQNMICLCLCLFVTEKCLWPHNIWLLIW